MSRAAGTTRVLVCEDSSTYAEALRRLLQQDKTIEVVAVCSTAEAAIAELPAVQPDLVTMDIELPGMSGLEAVEQIMSTTPVPILVISSFAGRGSVTAAAALAAGALEVVAKDDLDVLHPDAESGVAFRRRVQLLAGAHVIKHPRGRLPRATVPPVSTAESRRVKVIGIVASTGGPQALSTVLSNIPADFAVPVLVVQHIAAGFAAGLAVWLDDAVPLPVQLARAGESLSPGVWIAPDGAHLFVQPRGTLMLDRQTKAGLHRPSGDVLLRSLADFAGPAAVGVILSGMGSDGAEGVAAIRAAGGVTIAQDEESSAIYGMPRAAAEHGVELVLPITEIAPTLIGLVRTGA
ncbi:MAG TPA: chemotaxis-specific protein-glutamate methyltransferase CheB [Gaiellaceae bacterium]|nr:chemotaxis-specific protein-glutamate methyltransferase CheB [Gaiellaceae bacterium]HWB21756.1 chemotaxis-specific protein-glutamate methyltransferase CheB [Gaiellaceae bacterium]